EAISKVRELILKNLPKGYEEAMNWGLISYEIPLSTYPDTYNKKPLMYCALGSQKNYMAVYLMGPYGSPPMRQKLEEAFSKAGKKLDMGGSCLRFKKLEDIELNVIGEVVAAVPMQEYIKRVKSYRRK